MSEKDFKPICKRPCANCPFRKDTQKGWLGKERAEEIRDSLLGGMGFPCHKTTIAADDDSGESVATSDSKMCAGAASLLEKIDRPNATMQLAERLNFQTMEEVKGKDLAVDDFEEFVNNHT